MTTVEQTMRYFISENGSILQFNPTDRRISVLKAKGWVVLPGAEIYHPDTAPAPPPFIEKPEDQPSELPPSVNKAEEPPPPPPYDEVMPTSEEPASDAAPLPPPPPPPSNVVPRKFKAPVVKSETPPPDPTSVQDEEEPLVTGVKALRQKLFGNQAPSIKKIETPTPTQTPVAKQHSPPPPTVEVPEQVSVSIVDGPNFEPGTLEISQDRIVNVFPIGHPIKIDAVSYDLTEITPTSTTYESLFKFRAEEALKLRELIESRQTETTLKQREVSNGFSNSATLQEFASGEIKRLKTKICSKTKVQKLEEALKKLKSYETQWNNEDLYEASYKQLFEDSGLKAALAIHRFSWSPKARNHKATQATENAERACPGIVNVI